MRDARRGAWWRAALAAAAVALAAGANGPPPFVPGDLIVKFTDDSERGALVARAVRGEAEAERQLPELAVHLTAELGVPLRAVRVTSGRELVLSVDRQELLDRLAARVRRDPAVKRARPRVEPATVLPPAEIALVVRFRPRSDGAKLLQSAAAGERRGPAIDALAARLAAGADPPPAAAATASGELLLIVDVAAVTVRLVERARARADVEYAQPSQVVRPFGAPRE